MLVELAMREEGYSHMRPVIEKELLHYDLLFVLDKQGLLILIRCRPEFDFTTLSWPFLIQP